VCSSDLDLLLQGLTLRVSLLLLVGQRTQRLRLRSRARKPNHQQGG
jgi:hypothetical protein